VPNTAASVKATRGHGLLEGFLAAQRSRHADRLIPDSARSGRILDVGCGSYPIFLTRTRFSERYGLDRVVPNGLQEPGLTLIDHDLADPRGLPFADGFFAVVTMLAVLEHLDEDLLVNLIAEIRRVLAGRGLLVLTTPARWTTPVLRAMSRIGLVSSEEIDEHKQQHSKDQIVQLLGVGGFAPQHVEVGSFELGMNLWARARREG
jgi:SAM-dependent methyltransferase